jgi:hypothetical protein
MILGPRDRQIEPDSSSGLQFLLGTERCLLASAAVWLASTAKPLGPDQALRRGALNDALKQMTQRAALAKAAVPEVE